MIHAARGRWRRFARFWLAAALGPAAAAAPPVSVPPGAGPLELRLFLPSGREGTAEPLVATGVPAHGDTAFIYYDAPGRVRFGWDSSADGEVLSAPVTVSGPNPHRVLISMGSLLPPAPAAGADQPPASVLSRLFFVQLDGRNVVRYQGDFQPESQAGGPALGENRVGSALLRPFFTGRLISATAVNPLRAMAEATELGPWIGRAGGEYPGAVRLRLRFSQAPAAAGDPLVVGGRTGRGDLLYAQILDADHLRFGYDHWAVGGLVSRPIEADLGAIHEVTLTMGCLYAPGDPAAARWRGRIAVWLDGRPAFDGTMAAHPSTAGQITVGCNLIGGSTTGGVFRGQIFGVEAVSPAALAALPGP